MTNRTSIPMHMLVMLVALAAMWGGAFTLIKVLIDTLRRSRWRRGGWRLARSLSPRFSRFAGS